MAKFYAYDDRSNTPEKVESPTLLVGKGKYGYREIRTFPARPKCVSSLPTVCGNMFLEKYDAITVANAAIQQKTAHTIVSEREQMIVQSHIIWFWYI